MKQDIRKRTYLIVSRGSEYLVGWDYIRRRLNWSFNAYDAWRTRDIEAADRVARKCGGTLRLFNPVAGQQMIYEG